MKRKMTGFFVILAVALIAGLNFLKQEDNIELSNLTLDNVEALASGETGTGGCMTVTNTELTYQDCDGHRRVSRYRVKYSCKGQSGECKSGSMYYFYDCNGMEIGTNDHVLSASCS